MESGRNFTSGYILFEECIQNFWDNTSSFASRLDINQQERITAHILLDFELEEEICVRDITICKTIRHFFSNGDSAFIAPVILPEGRGIHTSNFFTTALSAIVSFIIRRPATSVRDYTLQKFEPGNKSMLAAIGINMPVTTSGNGATDAILAKATLQQYKADIINFIDILYRLSYKDYYKIMQAVRLVNLAHLTLKTEFSLSFYLLVSAIESIAQEAIKVEDVKEEPHKLLQEWQNMAQNNEVVKALLSLYQNEQKTKLYLTRRFTDFIIKYCPSTEWENLKHQYENREMLLQEQGWPASGLAKKSFHEKYPSDLSERELKTIIKDTYNYRSKYTHAGQSTPHTQPNSYNRFFDEEIIEDGKNVFGKRFLVANYSLLSFIATTSIYEFSKKILQ